MRALFDLLDLVLDPPQRRQQPPQQERERAQQQQHQQPEPAEQLTAETIQLRVVRLEILRDAVHESPRHAVVEFPRDACDSRRAPASRRRDEAGGTGAGPTAVARRSRVRCRSASSSASSDSRRCAEFRRTSPSRDSSVASSVFSGAGSKPPLLSSSDAEISASICASRRSCIACSVTRRNAKSSAAMVMPKNTISRMLTEASSRVLRERGPIQRAARVMQRFRVAGRSGNRGRAGSLSV